jgi:hypothetical protein
MSRETAPTLVSLGVGIIILILSIVLKTMPLYWIIIGYCIGGLLILYGIFGWVKPKQIPIDFEIKIKPSKYSDKTPYYGVTPGRALTAIFDLLIINHNVDQKLRIETASLNLCVKRFFLKKNLFSMPLTVFAIPQNYTLSKVDIDPQSEREFHILTSGNLPIIRPFPINSQIVLGLDMIGPIRHKEYVLETIKHNPKKVPDIPKLPSRE